MTRIESMLAAAAAVLALNGTDAVQAPSGAAETRDMASAAGPAGAAIAQTAPQAPQGPARDVTRPSTTLAQAVRLAEQRTNGRARKVELERDDGAYVYEVKTVSDEGTAKVIVDYASGNVDRVKGRGFVNRISDLFDRDDRREEEAALKALEASSVTLAQAVEAAETATGGRAVKAKMKDRYGTMLFEVGLLVEGAMRRVEVDAATGKAVTVRARDDGDGDGEEDGDDD